MGFSDAFQGQQQSQNSSFKTDPAQRDASSRNAELYEVARQRRTEGHAPDRAKEHQAGQVNNDSGLIWSDDANARRPTHRASDDLPAFDVDSRGNVYLTNDGSKDSSGWRQKAKGLLKGRFPNKGDKTVVIH